MKVYEKLGAEKQTALKRFKVERGCGCGYPKGEEFPQSSTEVPHYDP